MVNLKATSCALVLILPSAVSFHLESLSNDRSSLVRARSTHSNDSDFEVKPESDRRSFLSFAAISAGMVVSTISTANPANAAIDVSGLRQDGGGGNSVIASQLKSYDGSAAARVQEIRATTPVTQTQSSTTTTPVRIPTTVDTGSAATYAYRSGGLPILRRSGLGLINRYEGYVVSPPNSKITQIPISFEFPSDWIPIDKIGNGINYVDQRNGDKLYVLLAPLPDGTTLETVSKSFFAESIFDTRGDIVRSGLVVESARTAKSKMLDDCDGGKICSPHRRILIKYDTVTGNGVQTVERRGLVDAYEIDGYAYMLMTSSNAVKFEAKGIERETVENIVNSFRLGL